MAPDRRVGIFLQKLRRDVFENREPKKILGGNRRPIRLTLNVFQLFKKQSRVPRGRPAFSSRRPARQSSYSRPQRVSPSSAEACFPRLYSDDEMNLQP